MILHEFISYDTLRVIWWALLGVLLIGFALTDGFDMGVGALLPFVAKNDTERRVVINTVGPVWEGNQVWFILGGGAIFAAWPPLYAVSFSGFYLAMFVVLAALIVRPVAFKYRSKRESPLWRSGWDWALFAGGAVPALIFGVAVGNVLQGVPFELTPDLFARYEGEASEEVPKPPRASLPKSWAAEGIDLEKALMLLDLPREIGPHPDDGEMVEAAIGRYGPYVKHGRTYANLPDVEEVFTIGMNRAVEVLAQKAARGPGRGAAAQPIKELGEHPDGGAIQVMPGRYGPYVKWGKINATLPKELEPEAVTLEEALPLLAAKASKGGRKKAAPRKAAAKAPAKKAAAKKPAAKKPAAKKAASKG